MTTSNDWFAINYDFQDDYEITKNFPWHKVSLERYGRDDLAWLILEANPQITQADRVGFGPENEYTLRIPDIDPDNIENLSLPRWRRAAQEN